MQKYSSFINKQHLHEIILEIISNSKETRNKIGDLCYMYDFDGAKLTDTDTYQFFINNLVPKTKVEKMLYNMLLRTMYQTETLTSKSANFSFVYALHFLENFIMNQKLNLEQDTVLISEFEKLYIEKLKPWFESRFNNPTIDDIYKLIETQCGNDYILSFAIKEAINMGGFESRIFLEPSKQSNYIVELKNGYAFKAIEPYKYLLDNNTSWIRNSSKIMIVDGIIEEVSELDKLMNKAHETQQPLIIVAMGFGEEVVATCKVNNDQNKFDIQLVRFTNDVWSLNTANDISVVCGTTPITSLQGQMVSMIEWDELPTVDKVNLTLNQLSIENNSTRESVLLQIQSILDRKKTANAMVEDIQNIYDSRLKALAANSVCIYLPSCSEIELNSKRIQIDNILRSIKTILNYGNFDASKLEFAKPINELEKVIQKSLLTTLTSLRANEKTLPLLSIAMSTYLTTKTCLMLITSNGLIVTS